MANLVVPFFIIFKEFEIMLSPQRIEKRIFKISLWSGVIFVVAELIMAAVSRSQTVLMDAAYDAAELIVIAVSLLLTPLFYKPVSEKHPFGYFQCESLFIVIKGFMMVSVTIGLMFSNIQIMLDGGRLIDNRMVMLFEALLSLISLGVLLLLGHYSKQVTSPSAKAEIYAWRVDFLCSAGVAAAFLAPPLMQGTSLEWMMPYFDQMVAVVLVVFVLPEPIKMIFTAFCDLLLFPPEVTEEIREMVQQRLDDCGYDTLFVEVTQTGRRIWVAVTFRPHSDTLSMRQLQAVRAELTEELRALHDDLELELVAAG